MLSSSIEKSPSAYRDIDRFWYYRYSMGRAYAIQLSHWLSI